MKVVDTREYVSMLRELVENGHDVSMLIAGNSMSPFLIHQRDQIYFSTPKSRLRTGDMVFYERDNGQFVMHRICKVHKGGTYDIIGDAQLEIEHGIRRDQIFARIDHVKRKRKDIYPGNFLWFFFEKIWPRVIPLRPMILKSYGITAKIRKSLHRQSK